MVNRELIQSLLLQLEERVRLLKVHRPTRLSVLERDPILQNACLHLLQTAVEICLDMANHCIADEGWRAPSSAREAFQVLSEQGVISKPLLQVCQQMAGFRNIVVHMYEKVELADVYAILRHHLRDFSAFAQALRKFLKRKSVATRR